jgi:hypothetical protein
MDKTAIEIRLPFTSLLGLPTSTPRGYKEFTQGKILVVELLTNSMHCRNSTSI